MGQGNSAFLDKIGLGFLDVGYFVIGVIVLSVIVLVLIILLAIQINKTSKLKKRLDKFLIGKDGASLEQDIISICEDNKFLKFASDKNRKDIAVLFKRMETAYQKMGLVKYDAFSQMGGQLSFCLAMLDENNDGFILNSVHSTEGCYSYTKEIRNGDSSIPLGKEEEEAISIAKQKVF